MIVYRQILSFAFVAYLINAVVFVFSTADFKRLRQDIEVDADGLVHVFLRVLDYNSSFELLLQKREDNVFTSDHVMVVGKEEIPVDTDFMFSGSVKGHPSSSVYGSIHDNNFEGSITLEQNLRYEVESGQRLFGRDFCNDKFRYCHVIYRHEETHDEKLHKRSSEESGLGMCGWHSQKVREALQIEPLFDLRDARPSTVSDEHNHRKKREAAAVTSTVKMCNIFMQADPKLWEMFLSDYNNNEAKARSQLLRYFGQIIDGVNEIYGYSVFSSSDGTFQNFQFKISRTAIYTSQSTCGTSNAGTVTYELCRDNIDSAEFLSINSKMKHDSFCLAYLMTHRQFSEGVQGLAWIGYPKSYAGGVCQKYVSINGKDSSYNTGIVTSNNYGKRSNIKSLILTFAHEIGHNFGSPHDPSDCQPGSTTGNYIMYPYVSPGNLPNNKKFSSCSNEKIANNLNAVVNELNSNKRNCFSADTAPFCGNGIVEGNEVCDCGFADDCQAAGDNCCQPAGGSNGCTLRQGAQCSTSNGPCCDLGRCSFMSQAQASGTICRQAAECADAAYCSTTSAACPPSPSKPDGSLCWENSRVCQAGDCSQSLCSMVKSTSGVPYDSCQQSIADGDTNLDKYCFLACKPPGSDSCLNSDSVLKSASLDPAFYSFLVSFGNRTKAPSLGSGSPCNNYKGFCDVFRKCRNVNSQGPLASLFSLLSGDKAPETAAQWLVKYWYVVAIVAVVFVAICLVLTQIFARVCLPSSNPKKHGKRTLTDSCRRTLCCNKNAKVSSSQN